MTLQERVDRLRGGKFLGVPIDDYERAGREQLIFLLMNGLNPSSRLLDIGCGTLRGGYWLIHFLDADRYCGIEPSAERLAAGMQEVIEAAEVERKRPRFDTNPDFDTGVFGTTFDYFLAYSIWTHASKTQIGRMLDGFLRDTAANGVFLTSVVPARRRRMDYTGDSWHGTSHECDVPGFVRHSLSWIEAECRRRKLTLRTLGRDAIGQTWLRISRDGSTPTIDAVPTPRLLCRLLDRRR